MKIGTFIIPIMLFGSISFAQESIMWSGGEHLELGERGALAACRELGIKESLCPIKTIHRADKKVSFSYGEILTAADYYNTPTELYKDERKGIKNVIACAHEQMHVQELQQENGDADYPTCNIKGIVSMPTYLEVVSQNYAHFGWYNMVAYVKYHQIAINKAVQSFNLRKSDPTQSYELFNQALVANAFADHYLTDAFASGHIRVPRVQIKEWATKGLNGPLRAKRGDLLTMLLHDRESISLKTQKEEGLLVKNAQGDTWVTRGDQHLHLNSPTIDPTRYLPEQAVQASMKEVLTAWTTGETPDGIFNASWIVPFHQDVPLTEKFSAKYQNLTEKNFLAAFFKGMPIYERLLYRKSDLSKMIDALPEIFVKFRKDVTKDIQDNPELSHRLPARYLEAYSNVN